MLVLKEAGVGQGEFKESFFHATLFQGIRWGDSGVAVTVMSATLEKKVELLSGCVIHKSIKVISHC